MSILTHVFINMPNKPTNKISTSSNVGKRLHCILQSCDFTGIQHPITLNLELDGSHVSGKIDFNLFMKFFTQYQVAFGSNYQELNTKFDVDIFANLAKTNRTLNIPVIITKDTISQNNFNISSIDLDINTPSVISNDAELFKSKRTLFTPISVPFIRTEYAGKNQFRLGYSIFKEPILSVEKNTGSYYKRKYMLRSQGSTKKSAGDVYESYSINLTIRPDQIQSSLLPFLKQISLTPFITAEGGCFGIEDTEVQGDVPWHEIAVRNVTLSSIPGYPDTMNLAIDFEPFLWSQFVPPLTAPSTKSNDESKYDKDRAYLDDLICWPLFKIWSEQKAFPRFDPLSSKVLNGGFTCSFPNPKFMEDLAEIALHPSSINPIDEDIATLETLSSSFITRNSDIFKSDKVREIIPSYITKEVSKTNRIYVVKLQSSEAYKLVAGQLITPSIGGQSTFPQLIGLIDWKKLESFSYYDEVRGIVPLPVTVETIQSVDPWHKSPSNLDEYNVCDIKVLTGTKDSFASQIRDYVTNGEVKGLPTRNQSQETLIADMTTNPWKYFAVVFESTQDDVGFQKRISELTSKLKTKNSFTPISTNINQEILQKFKEHGPDLRNDGEYVYKLDNEGSRGQVIIEQISVTRGHNLSLLDTLNTTLPIHQYMGGLDAVAVVKGKAFGEKGKAILDGLKAEVDLRNKFKITRRYLASDDKRNESRSATFLKVDNEIFQLMGIDFAVPITYTIKAVQGQPNVWDYSITFVDTNFKTLLVERVRYLQTFSESINKLIDIGPQNENNSISPFIQKALDWNSLQKKLRQEEVYPDMNLPTLGEVDYWVDCIIKIANLYKKISSASISISDWPKIRDQVRRTITDINLKAIFEIIYPFLEDTENLRTITDPALWSSLKTGQYGNSLYAEPDFYCYYYSDEYDSNGKVNPVKSAYDLWRPTAVGQHNPKTGISKPVDPEQIGKPTITMVDQQHGTLSLLPDEYLNGQNSGDIAKAIQEQTYALDQKTWEKKKQAYTSAQLTLQNTPGAWWERVDNIKVDSNNVRIEDVDDYVSYVFKNSNPSVLVRSNSGNFDTDFVKHKFYPEADTLSYRAEFLRKLVYEYRRTVTFPDIDVKELYKGNFWHNNFDSDYWNEHGGFEAWEQNEIDQTIANTKTLPAEANGNPYSRKLQSFIDKTFYANGLYEAALNDSSSVFSLNKPAATFKVLPLLEIRKAVAYYSYRKDVDPNIILAYLLTVDAFGTDNINDQSLTSFGQVRKSLFNQVDEPTVTDILGLIVSKYHRYITSLRSPTLALIALYQELTFGELDPHTIELLSSSSRKIKIHLGPILRYSEDDLIGVRDSISNLMSLPGTHIIDRIYANYIQIGRTIGTIFLFETFTDAFFNPLNFLMLQDEVMDDKGSIVSDPVVWTTSFTPSGKKTDINISPKNGQEVTQYTPLLENANVNTNASVLQIEENHEKYDLLLKPNSEAGTVGAVHDMLKYSSYGRLVGAFPAYQILIINEGFFWSGGTKKLWDQFYTRTGVTEIEVYKSRLSPSHSCRIEFSNTYFTLTSYPLIEAFAQDLAVYTRDKLKPSKDLPKTLLDETWNNLIAKNVPDDVRRIWKNNHLKQLALTPGARLQVRMGYGSDASSLPVIFNGTIVECPISDGAIEIYAAGDGIELEKDLTHKVVNARNSYAFSDGGFLGQGKDPSTIVADSLVSCSLFDNLTGGNFRDLSKGVQHFGDVYYAGDYLFIPTEILQNIYSSNPGQLEQAIPSWKNWLNVNAVYSWDNSVNISVEVEEPTPWKVIQTCRLAIPDFVASVEPFATRSTLFFGKWWWPFYYDYKPTIYQLPKAIDNSSKIALETNKKILAERNNKVTTDYQELKKNPELIDLMSAYLGTPLALIYTNEDAQNASEYRNDKNSRISSLIVGAERFYPSSNDPDWIAALAIAFGGGSSSRPTPGRTWTEWHLERLDGTYYVLRVDDSDGHRISGSKTPISKEENESKRLENIRNTVNQNGPEAGGADLSTTAFSNIQAYNFLKNVTDYVEHLKWKPFTQFYVAHSYLNLLDNQIKLSTAKMSTDSILEHKYNGLFGKESISRTMAFSLDANIAPSERKTMLVKSGLNVTFIQGGLVNQIRENLGWVPLMGEGIAGTPSTPAVQNSAIAALVDSVKTMYDGAFVMLASPTIKPHDIIKIYDAKNDIFGPVGVREVVHSMSVERGFITTITPDVIVAPKHSIVGFEWVKGILLGTLHRTVSYLTYKIATASTIMAMKRYLARRRFINARMEHDAFDIIRQNLTTLASDDKFKNYDWINKVSELDNKLQTETKQIIDDIFHDRQPTLVKLHGGPHNASDAIKAYHDSEILRFMKNNKILDNMKKTLDTKEKVFSYFGNDKLGEKMYTILHESHLYQSQESYIARLLQKKSLIGEVQDVTVGLKSFLKGSRTVRKTIKEAYKTSRTPKELFEKGGTKVQAMWKQAEPYVDVMKDAKKVLDEGKSVNEAIKVIKEAKEASNVITKAKEAFTSIKTLSFCSAPEFSVILQAAQYVSMANVLDYLNTSLDARNCAHIMPLIAGDVPFVAGIRGHAGAVIGDDPSWVDTLYNDLITPGAAPGAFWIACAASLAGLNMPQDFNNPSDKAFMNSLKDQIQEIHNVENTIMGIK